MLGARIGEPLGERGRDAVLLRHDGRHRGPRNRERRVVPAEAAHDAAARAGLDGLLELARQSARGEVRRHPRLEQETALVREDGGLEYPDRRDAARVDQHSVLRLQKRMGPWYRRTPERGSIAR